MGAPPPPALFLLAAAAAALAYFSLAGKVGKRALKGFTLENPNLFFGFALDLRISELNRTRSRV